MGVWSNRYQHGQPRVGWTEGSGKACQAETIAITARRTMNNGPAQRRRTARKENASGRAKEIDREGQQTRAKKKKKHTTKVQVQERRWEVFGGRGRLSDWVRRDRAVAQSSGILTSFFFLCPHLSIQSIIPHLAFHSLLRLLLWLLLRRSSSWFSHR